MISGVVYLLRIFKMFHGLMNNPLYLLTYSLALWPSDSPDLHNYRFLFLQKQIKWVKTSLDHEICMLCGKSF